VSSSKERCALGLISFVNYTLDMSEYDNEREADKATIASLLKEISRLRRIINMSGINEDPAMSSTQSEVPQPEVNLS
jgi:hypothetical protein